ncbi:hypothetical protein RBU55_30670 [Pseudomonas chlororaphis subsp. aurantiaca]|uniref:hypothetical protein n=1 Tax=Pseudomonas chlororaphis TaxID=587753 RepID=UPI0027DDCEA3|nr:hypothetical protein [Pseudomonas chlororaphis]WMI99844.1 hypothetical protein RBU55_30670 [Pseudomonas chlororaphis subsp. aurantiaca]
MTYSSYFKGAVWMPAIILPVLLITDAFYFSEPPKGGVEQFFLIYVLGFGLVAYFIFALWASRVINRKTAREVTRLAWWAPVIFIPFYGVPWLLYGLANLLLGKTSGLGMMFLWLAYVPYVLVAGYFFATTSVLISKVVIK